MQILAYACIGQQGIVTPAGLSKWQDGQCGPASLKRDQVLARPYPTFGKLPLAERIAFGCAALILENASGCIDENTGICAAVPWGSLSTDLNYTDSLSSGFPSPAHFSATLPSSVISEIAICYKLKGPNRVLCGPQSSLGWALESALTMLATNRCPSVLFVYSESIETNPALSRLGITTLGPQGMALLLAPNDTNPDCRYTIDRISATKPGEPLSFAALQEYFTTQAPYFSANSPVPAHSICITKDPRNG